MKRKGFLKFITSLPFIGPVIAKAQSPEENDLRGTPSHPEYTIGYRTPFRAVTFKSVRHRTHTRTQLYVKSDQ